MAAQGNTDTVEGTSDPVSSQFQAMISSLGALNDKKVSAGDCVSGFPEKTLTKRLKYWLTE